LRAPAFAARVPAMSLFDKYLPRHMLAAMKRSLEGQAGA